MKMEYTIRIGGAAGQGMQFINSLLVKFFSQTGFYLFNNQDYMSRIRGGHNFSQIRVATQPVTSSRNHVDLLVALNLETIEIHHQSLTKGGLILYDADAVGREFDGFEYINIPMLKISKKTGADKKTANSVAVGSVLAALGLELGILPAIMESYIAADKSEVTTAHFAAAQAGFTSLSDKKPQGNSLQPLPLSPTAKSMKLINGNQAIGLGALVSGCKFYSAYPMTPSTSIMLYLAAKAKKHGIVVEQAEDEISAINMAIGASYGGVRAMTGTSGGGFALMTEGISLAGITETPLVIAEVQRPGPATGLPTRTEQSDLFFVLFGGHGEFAKVVFTPGTPEQALFLTNKAFHLAEKYQIPVIIQSDQYLADSGWTYSELDTDKIQYTEFRLRGDELNQTKKYQRYAYTESGISPLAVPGDSTHVVVADSDEHDQDGHIIEDALTRNKMVEKRYFKKMALLEEEIASPDFYGSRQPDIILVGFGSTFGVIKEAVDLFSDKHQIAMLHFSEIFPFPKPDKHDYLKLLNQAKVTLCIENNASGQFAALVKMQTGFSFTAGINKFDGRPFGLDNLTGEINGHLRGL